MGIRINTGSGIDPTLVDKLIELEKRPIKTVEDRKEKVIQEQKLFQELTGLISTLGTTLNSFRNRMDFVKLKVESSHPDIIDGTADNTCLPGNYEIEVRQLARTHKLLAEAFPDKDKTSVGFGYLTIELEDGRTHDIEIDPDQSTLQDVARQINAANIGAKAVVINTKEYLEHGEETDSYRLLVISEKSGKPAKVYIDPDTTWLEFKEQVTGRNLEMLFEDVPVYDDDNTVDSLLPGLVLNAKRAEPGTRVNIKIDYDIDGTLENIKKFVESYNKVNEFIEKQFQLDPATNKAGPLSKDNTLRSIRRALQNAMQIRINGGKYATLADVGITTDPKTGALKIDETKLKKCLAEDYNSVAELFIRSDKGEGVGIRMSESIRALQNSREGAIGSREREYKRILQNFDDDIARKERIAAQRAEGLKRKFAALEQLVSGLNAQGQAMQARLGNMGQQQG